MNNRAMAGKATPGKADAAASDRAAAVADVRDKVTDIGHRLDCALRVIDDLRDQVFALQEQNQQLRRDLADRVCPRLCSRPYRGAS